MTVAMTTFEFERNNGLRGASITRLSIPYNAPAALYEQSIFVHLNEWREFVQFVMDRNSQMPERIRWETP